jgi:hypothetical protein
MRRARLIESEMTLRAIGLFISSPFEKSIPANFTAAIIPAITAIVKSGLVLWDSSVLHLQGSHDLPVRVSEEEFLWR